MKLDPNNNDAVSSVGCDLGDGYNKYKGTMAVGIDGCRMCVSNTLQF